jgi:hypothetical protein
MPAAILAVPDLVLYFHGMISPDIVLDDIVAEALACSTVAGRLAALLPTHPTEQHCLNRTTGTLS